jgi:hypothetical protein
LTIAVENKKGLEPGYQGSRHIERFPARFASIGQLSGGSRMDLETFISQSLKEIIAGIRSAQQYVAQSGTGAAINPRGITALQKDSEGMKQPHDMITKLPVHQVEFDVAVTVAQSSQGKAGAGLLVAGLGIGGQKASTAESSSVSRVKFTVPLIWPDPQTAK